MNTIRIRAAAAIWAALMAFQPVLAQGIPDNPGDTAFAVTIIPSAGIGTVMHAGAAAVREEGWFMPGITALWKPNRRLNIGIEAAYLNLERVSKSIDSEEYERTEMSAWLDALAVIFVFDMEVWKLNISGGMGASLVRSSVTAYGSTVDASSWMASYYGSAAYYLPLAERLSIGIKAGVYSIPKIDKITGGISLAVSYDILQW